MQMGAQTYQARESAAAERERLILEHLPQVRLIARRIHERLPDSVSLEDLISTGIVGLISAIVAKVLLVPGAARSGSEPHSAAIP